MNNPPDFTRTLTFSTVGHVLLVVVFLLSPFLIRPKKISRPREIITWVNLQPPGPQMPDVVPVDHLPPPPVKETPIAPIKETPLKPPPPKKQIEISQKKIKREDVKLPTPSKPKLSDRDIRKAFDDLLQPVDGRPADEDDLPGWYYALIRQTMYDAWNKPGGAGIHDGMYATMQIRVERNGAVTRREMIRSSGNTILDQSVTAAVNAVTRLRPLPPPNTDAYQDITIDFEITL